MAVQPTTRAGDAIRERYLARTPRSRELFERATRSIPGGSTRTTVFSAPYPPFLDRGEGAHTWDVDGNRYLDLLMNYTSLILGHAAPEVVAAVTEQAARGSAFAAPTILDVDLEERGICLRPSEPGSLLAEENGVLVFTGQVDRDLTGFIDEQREARLRELSGGLDPLGHPPRR